VLDSTIPSNATSARWRWSCTALWNSFGAETSAAASAFRDALAIRIDIKGDLVSRFDPALALIWKA